MNTRAVAQLFKMDLDQMFNQWNASKPMRTGMPHASSILAPESEYCLRRLVLLAISPEQAVQPPQKPWDSHTNAVFLNGWTLHEKYQMLFKRFGQVVELEKSHYDDVRLLHFTPDAILNVADEQMVVEIKGYKAAEKNDKASSHDTFDKLDEAGPAPHAAHVQANFYMHLLELNHALILVESKNSQHYKVWCVEYDFAMCMPQIDRMYDFKSALAGAEHNGHIPARCCVSQSDRQAQKCPVRALCFKERG